MPSDRIEPPFHSQLELFPHVGIRPTIAMQRGDTYVTQCAWCGLLVCASTKVKLGRCPHPHPEERGWWKQRLPVGPFFDPLDRDSPPPPSISL
jgi:hypothetical protein